jgi:hypothetical protein
VRSAGIGAAIALGKERRDALADLGIILLAIAIAGGAIVHPILFVLGILALFMFVSGWRGRAT